MAYMAITGASSGIGAAAAVELTRLGHHVCAIGRSTCKLSEVQRRMVAVAPGDVEVPSPIVADFARLAEVRRVAFDVLERTSRVDVLVNNAAVQPRDRRLSGDGYELSFAVNHLAPFLLTKILGSRLRQSGGRVITTSSSDHADATLDLTDIHLEKSWGPHLAYSRSKLANILFTLELPRRAGIPAASFHPGSITTDLNRESPYFRLVKPFERLIYGTPEKGADTMIWLATSAEGAAPTAPYYVKKSPAKTSASAIDRDLAAQLWSVSEEMVTDA